MSPGMTHLNSRTQAGPSLDLADILRVQPWAVVTAECAGRLRVTVRAIGPGGVTGWMSGSPVAGADILDMVLSDEETVLRTWRADLGELDLTDESCQEALLLPGGSRRRIGTVIAWGDRHDRVGSTWSLAVLLSSDSRTWFGTGDDFATGDDEGTLMEDLDLDARERGQIHWGLVPIGVGRRR